eukprot:1365828-Alexandrium_andersonii.AAC.1
MQVHYPVAFKIPKYISHACLYTSGVRTGVLAHTCPVAGLVQSTQAGRTWFSPRRPNPSR